MAAEDKKSMQGNGICNCNAGGRHWTFFLLRTLLTVLILMVVFWFGVVAGRLSGYRESGYGMMMRRGAMPMMQTNGATSTMPSSGSADGY